MLVPKALLTSSRILPYSWPLKLLLDGALLFNTLWLAGARTVSKMVIFTGVGILRPLHRKKLKNFKKLAY
jgi:hypothetical protein